MDTTSIRLPEHLTREIDRLADDRHTTRTAVICEAVEQYCAQQRAGRGSDRLALLRRLVTYEGSGRGDLAERAEEHLRVLFEEKRRRAAR
jgi:metal-responsive CopG/Arc/MetJ family transcriptional regulator